MEIRHSKPEDLDRIMEIYAYARKFMAEHGNPRQWGHNNWPPRELVENDIRIGKGYVCVEDGRVVGNFFFDHGHRIDPTYDQIEDGAWIGDENYGVVHRLAGDGSVKGIGAFCINWAYAQCGHLRVDTHADNIVLQSLATKLGFHKCGIIHVVQDTDPRYAYEKN